MKVVHLITGTDIGGAEMMLSRLLNHPNDGIDPVVVSIMPSGSLADQIRSTGAALYSLDINRGAFDVRAISRLYGLLRWIRPAIIMSWLYHADALATPAKLFGMAPRLIWNLRGSNRIAASTRDTPLLVKILARCSRIPDVVVANSHRGREWHEQVGYRPRSWVVIPNGIDLDVFKPNVSARARVRALLGLPETAVIIAMPARFHPMKGHSVFFAAAEKLVSLRSDVYFLLMGKDVTVDNPHLMAMGVNRLDGHVRILGQRNDLSSIYPAVDVVTLSSLWGEGFPNVLLEALACSVPCVATDVGDARMIIGNAGLVVPLNDPETLSSAWHQILSVNGENRCRLARYARRRAEKFGITQTVSLYRDLFMKVSELEAKR